MIIIKDMFVLQELNADDFVRFITTHRPYEFDTDIENIKKVLNDKFGEQASYKDILQYMLNNINLDLKSAANIKKKFTCYNYFERWLNQIETQNKNVPNIGFDTTDILIAVLAFTGTGISWIIWGLREPPLNAELGVLAGTINVFIFILFAASLCFSWGLAVRIILGILFSLFEIYTIRETIRNVFEHRESRRKSNQYYRTCIADKIPKMREYLNQVKGNQNKNNQSDKTNNEMKNELDNTDNNFPTSQELVNEDDKKK